MTQFGCPFGCGVHEFPRECRVPASQAKFADADQMVVQLQRAKRDAEEAANVKFDHRRLRSLMDKPRDAGDMTMEELMVSMKAAAKKSRDEELTMLMYGQPTHGKTRFASTVQSARAIDRAGNSMDLQWDEAKAAWVQVPVVTCGGCDADVPEWQVASTGKYRGRPVCRDCDELFTEQGSGRPMFAAGPCTACGRITPSEQMAPRAVCDKQGKVLHVGSYCRDCRTGAP